MIIDVKNLLTTYDLKSAVKKVRPINTWGFVIPLIKGKAYSFAADCKSAEPK